MERGRGDVALIGLLVAVMCLLGYTPLGAIAFGPVSITLLPIPVLIGTMVLGLRRGLLLGFFFGLISFTKLFLYPSALLTPLLLSPLHWYDPIFYIVLIFGPRLVVPVTTNFLARLPIKNTAVRCAIAAVGGTLTNGVLFTGCLYLFFRENIAANFHVDHAGVVAILFGVFAVNELIECSVNLAVCTPVSLALLSRRRGAVRPAGRKKSKA